MKMNHQKQAGRMSLGVMILLAFLALGAYVISNVEDSMSTLTTSMSKMSALVAKNTEKIVALSKTFQTQQTAKLDADSTKKANQAAQDQKKSIDTAQMLAQFEMPADFVPNSAEGSIENAPFSHIDLAEISSGSRAIELLGSNLNTVAQWYGMTPDKFKQLLLDDHTMFIDRKGRVLNVDDGVNGEEVAGEVVNATTATAVGSTNSNLIYPLDQTFKLHSKPLSTRILHLNFKGLGAKPAFDLDKIVGTFSTAEQTMIQKIWARVKEDYAPFDVDVTTEPPTSVTGKVGTSILITNLVHTAGGYAYLNSFSSKLDVKNPPAFCFQNNLGNSEKAIAECISHELGHALGLKHQSTASVAYFGGGGEGETGWAPIMGVSYYKNLTQWSKGEFTGATNSQDAYAVMSIQGLKPRIDDYKNTIATAKAMTKSVSNGLNNLSIAGIIETPTDIDMFSFSAGLGQVSMTISTSVFSGNLDAKLELFDAKGISIATSNNDLTLDTTVTVSIAKAGTYYLAVTGAGKGDPKQTGYTNYGSLGQYSIKGTSH
jgi:hypothetical protein